ncbi:MAG: pseudouridine synthase, partial [Asticcacaulis sp.]
MDHADESDQNTGPRQDNSPEGVESSDPAAAQPEGAAPERPARKDRKPDFKGEKVFKGGADFKGGKDAKANLKTERIAKVLARAGLASRREVERLIGLGKIAVNGRILATPAVLVSTNDVITVDGQPIGKAEPTRLWRYHKPVGLVTTHRDPQGRPTVFDKLPQPLPRVISIGRLDLNSEGLLLLTNDGELARALELPSTGWVRRYRARALGHTSQARLDALKDGTTVDGVIYGPIEATLDKLQDKADGRANVWITVAITEGKNREVRKVLESLGLKVNRLIRLAYGPFQLGNLEPGDVEEVGPRVIRELLADKIDPRNLPPEGATQT